ncbi:MAG TPA: hypothetical protein VLA91_11540 [Acidimicrobiia bacterium]|nr:hypothetical protein [Acidimicrobiia bacterium]
MGRPERSPAGAKRSVSISVLVGLVLVPLSAYAATILVGDRTPAESEASIPAPVATSAIVTDFATQTASAADLEAACGDAGLGMVSAETSGSIGGIEQAALDALREICAQEGMPLPGKAVSPPITQTVVLADNGPAPRVGSEVEWEVEYDDDWDDDDWDDDDWDDDDRDDDDRDDDDRDDEDDD